MPLRLTTRLLTLVLALCTFSPAQSVPLVSAPRPQDGTLLPPAFSGWEKTHSTITGQAQLQLDAKAEALLKEAGFAGFEIGTYTRQPNRALTIKALRFNDATGAFAAFSALRTPGMAEEKFCNHAASAATHILIACTDLVLDITYDKVTAMSPAEMRALVTQLAKASGPPALPANAPLYLPKDARKDVRFALGPVGLEHTGTPLNAEVIDFSKGAEVAVGHFESVDGPGMVTLIKYPTFAIAVDRQKAIDEFGRTLPKPGPDAPQLSTFYTRRVGPIVAVVSGTITTQDAQAIAEKVPYDVEITRNEPAYTQKDNVANLVVNVLYLSFIIIGFTFVTGIAFGGFRILSRKFFPGRFVDRPDAVDFIKLDLRD
jgi:hypothetical protein